MLVAQRNPWDLWLSRLLSSNATLCRRAKEQKRCDASWCRHKAGTGDLFQMKTSYFESMQWKQDRKVDNAGGNK